MYVAKCVYLSARDVILTCICRAPFSSLCIIPKRLFGVPPSHALSVINGNIVALCGVDLMEESSQESDAISSLRILTQRSSLCTCYGFGKNDCRRT